MARRRILTREGIVAAGVAVADRSGIEGVSMRSVGKELGVEGMSLYHHVTNKDDLLDALAAWVFEQIELSSGRCGVALGDGASCAVGAPGPSGASVGDRHAGVSPDPEPGALAAP
ncbi:TetR/AcrR family transcriptional regulator [Salana multivorans]